MYSSVRQPTNDDRDLLYSSDFSDTSFDSDADASRPGPGNNAYAATSVLIGLNSTVVNHSPPNNQQLVKYSSKKAGANLVAPLAESESLSLAPSIAREPEFLDSNLLKPSTGDRSASAFTDYMNPLHIKIRNVSGTVSMEPDNATAARSSSAIANKEIWPTEIVAIGTNVEANNGSVSRQTSCTTRPRLPVRPPPLAFGKTSFVLDESNTNPLNTVSEVTNSNGIVSSVSSVPIARELNQASVNDQRQVPCRNHHFPHKPLPHAVCSQDAAIVVGICTALYPFAGNLKFCVNAFLLDILMYLSMLWDFCFTPILCLCLLLR